ncbi:MAG: hypothetical protein V7703_03465 [Hyphomicrobiales bacterium]
MTLHRHTMPPLGIDTPDRHGDEFHGSHNTPRSKVNIPLLCIITAIAAAAMGAFVTMLHYT